MKAVCGVARPDRRNLIKQIEVCMQERKLQIGAYCHLVETVYGGSTATSKKDIALEYTEFSPDSWYADRLTTIDIDEAKAREIVNFLREAFGI